MCSGSRQGYSRKEITKSKALTTRLRMHRLLTWATLGWHSRLPPSMISRSIKWTYARLSWQLTWRKRSICTSRRDIFVWSQLGADTTIQSQRFRRRWYPAWESLCMAWSSLRKFGTALLWTSWSWLDLRHHESTEDCLCSMIRIKAQSLPQSFCTSMISLSLLTRAWLGRSGIRWRRGSGCMIPGVSPSISAWT